MENSVRLLLDDFGLDDRQADEMSEHDKQSTRGSLLDRLRTAPRDSADWDIFVQQYSPQIHSWCRRWGVREDEAMDVTQIVLVKFLNRVQTFEYNPSQSFRAWLKTVTYHAWRDFIDSRKLSRLTGGDETVAVLGSLEARDNLAEYIEQEYRRAILEEAMTRVRLRVKPKHWTIFTELALEGKPRQETADRHSKTVDAVRMIKNRVQTQIREEIQRLEGL